MERLPEGKTIITEIDMNGIREHILTFPSYTFRWVEITNTDNQAGFGILNNLADFIERVSQKTLIIRNSPVSLSSHVGPKIAVCIRKINIKSPYPKEPF